MLIVITQANLTDRRGHIRRVEFNSFGQVVKNVFPLGKPEEQVTVFNYDSATGRLSSRVDSLGRSTSYAYDTKVNTPQTIKFSYDNANRRTQVTLANGSKINTTYDNADQITAISYTKADGTSLGNLTYSYDGKGRRTGVGGTLTSTELPTAVTDPLYDANNRLTRWNGKTFQYDANGNLTNDGERSYSWNARDELQGLGGTQSASFRYDPMGRRSAKTISTTTTGYLYDGMDFVQELAGTTSTSGVRANLITGGLDEPLLRITGTGSTATLSHFFSDANNNVIALTDSTQAIATKYSYGAYGQSKQTTVSGANNTNSQQYTGRENDGTGLMYYRARYYHVGCARFISEDPIGWASGQTNNYAYVGGNPVNFIDPSGHIPIVAAALLIGGTAYASYQGYLAGQHYRDQQCATDKKFDEREQSETYTPAQEVAKTAEGISNRVQGYGPFVLRAALAVALAGVGANPLNRLVAAAGGGIGVYVGAKKSCP